METLLQDDKFKSSASPVARETCSAVKRMLEWCKDEKNSVKVNGFAEQVVQELQLCFSQSYKNITQAKERMWSMYHTTRISANFNATWHSFLSSALESYPPPLHQYVADNLFTLLIQRNFPTHTPTASQPCTPSTVTREEMNALRYVAGYTIRAVKDKLEKENAVEEVNFHFLDGG